MQNARKTVADIFNSLRADGNGLSAQDARYERKSKKVLRCLLGIY